MIYMLVLWPTAIFFFYLAWVATGVYLIKYRWALRAVAFSLFIFPIPAGAFLFPACVGLGIYGSDVFLSKQNDMMWAFSGSLKAVGIAGVLAWIVFEANAWRNRFEEAHKDQNPLNKRN